MPLREKITNSFRRSHVREQGFATQCTTESDGIWTDEGYYPRHTRLEEREHSETLHDPELIQTVTDMILAIRREALTAPSNIHRDGSPMIGIPFQIYDIPEYGETESRPDLLAQQHSPESGVVRVVHRSGGRIEHITFASDLQGREVIATIAVEVEGVANGDEQVSSIKLVEHSPGEVSELRIEPGKEIIVTDCTSTGKGHRLFRKDGEIIPDAIISDLSNLEDAICHRRVSARRLKAIHRHIEQLERRDEERQRLLEKINSVRQRRLDTGRFAVVNREAVERHPEALAASYARLDKEEAELQAELDALSALPRKSSIARAALNLVTRH